MIAGSPDRERWPRERAADGGAIASTEALGPCDHVSDGYSESSWTADDTGIPIATNSAKGIVGDMARRCALAVFAHPDDAELACFGSLAALVASGYEAHVVALTDGSNSRSETSHLRPGEAKEAANLISADLTIEHFADGILTADSNLHACISGHLARVRPSILFTHCPGADYHQDHEVVGRIVTAAATQHTSISLVLQAEPPIFVGSFTPNFFADITTSIKTKVRAVSTYKSEAGKWYMTEESVIERAAWWARQAQPSSRQNPHYFEAFRVAKALFGDWTHDWDPPATGSRLTS